MPRGKLPHDTDQKPDATTRPTPDDECAWRGFSRAAFGKPAVLTYHCDLFLTRTWFNRLVNLVVDFKTIWRDFLRITS